MYSASANYLGCSMYNIEYIHDDAIYPYNTGNKYNRGFCTDIEILLKKNKKIKK